MHWKQSRLIYLTCHRMVIRVLTLKNASRMSWLELKTYFKVQSIDCYIIMDCLSVWISFEIRTILKTDEYPSPIWTTRLLTSQAFAIYRMALIALFRLVDLDILFTGYWLLGKNWCIDDTSSHLSATFLCLLLWLLPPPPSRHMHAHLNQFSQRNLASRSQFLSHRSVGFPGQQLVGFSLISVCLLY